MAVGGEEGIGLRCTALAQVFGQGPISADSMLFGIRVFRITSTLSEILLFVSEQEGLLYLAMAPLLSNEREAIILLFHIVGRLTSIFAASI